LHYRISRSLPFKTTQNKLRHLFTACHVLANRGFPFRRFCFGFSPLGHLLPTPASRCAAPAKRGNSSGKWY
jgi:hypothetical protein